MKLNFFKKRNINNFNFGTFVLKSFRTFSFVVCSIASALFNLFFIGNLGGGGYLQIGDFIVKNWALMLTIAIGCEIYKLYHVTMVNTFDELLRKLKRRYPDAYTSMSQIAKRYNRTYIIFVALAITSSLFTSFYIMISLRSESTKNQTNAELIESSFDTIDGYESQIQDLKNSENPDAIFNSITEEFINPRNEIIKKFNSLSVEEKANYKNDFSNMPEYKNYTTSDGSGFSAYQQRFKSIIGSTRAENIVNAVAIRDDRITNYFNRDTDKKIKDLQDKIDKEELSIKNVESSIGETFNSKKDVEIYVSNLQVEKEKNSGTTGVFEWIVNALPGKMPASSLMAAMLFFLSVVIEFIIKFTAPKINITSDLLEIFSQYLPDNFPIDKFMNEVDKEQQIYGKRRFTNKEEIALDKSEMELVKAENEAKKKELKEKSTKIKEISKKLEETEKQNKELKAEEKRDEELDSLLKEAKDRLNLKEEEDDTNR